MAEGNTLRPSPAQNKLKLPLSVFFKDVRNVFKLDSIGKEILQIAVPAAMALAADPIASLIDTAFIGRIGPVELAAVGVSIAIFNQASKITIFPLVSITTSFVAQEETTNKIATSDEPHQPQLQPEGDDDHQNHMHIHTYHDDSSKQLNTQDAHAHAHAHANAHAHVLHKLEEGLASHKLAHDDESLPNDTNNILKMSATAVASKDRIATRKKHIPSASTALVLGGLLGLAQAMFLVFGAKTLLGVMGVKHDSPMLKPAHRYLTIRSLGAPAVLLSLAMQGVFRGFKDTKTPLYATVAADAANIILDPILMFACHLGVTGAAIAHVISQYLMSFILLWKLMKQVDLLPPSAKDLQLSRFLKNGFYLLTRVIAVTFCVTLAASMAARLGPTPMAAFQICLQIWLTSSLLADGLAVAGQVVFESSNTGEVWLLEPFIIHPSGSQL